VGDLKFNQVNQQRNKSKRPAGEEEEEEKKEEGDNNKDGEEYSFSGTCSRATFVFQFQI